MSSPTAAHAHAHADARPAASTPVASAPDIFVISDEEALVRLQRHTARLPGRGAYRRIDVALAVAQRERFERQINAHYRACGCFASALAVLTAIAALVVWHVVYPQQQGYGWGALAFDATMVLLAGAVTKVLALVRAHFALSITLRRLSQAIEAEQQRRTP